MPIPMNLNQVILPATDIAASIAFYRGMGFRLIVESPDYARFECLDGGATFSLHQVTEVAADTGVIVYFETETLDAVVADLVEKGYGFEQMPRDEAWLWREARLKDPDGNVICLYFAGENRRFPPWRVSDES